jgi:hypothetical protein
MLRWIWMTKEQILDVPLRGSKRFLNAKRGKCRDCEERTCPRTSYWQHTANLLERCMGNMLYHIGSILDSLSLLYIYTYTMCVCIYLHIYIYILCLYHANLDKYMQILSHTILYSLATLVYTCKSLDLCCQMLP